jgi:uncharacterized phage protein (TIGR01671 family)
MEVTMIEILFRAKTDPKENFTYDQFTYTSVGLCDWIEGSYIHQTHHYGSPVDRHWILTDGEFDYDYYDASRVLPETLSQFIGLIDKNGKKIFTGDIVRFHGGYLEGNWIGEVKYDGPCALLVLVGYMPCRYDSRYPSRFEVQISSRDRGTFEVIGNRWDNPELLEEDAYERLLVQR